MVRHAGVGSRSAEPIFHEFIFCPWTSAITVMTLAQWGLIIFFVSVSAEEENVDTFADHMNFKRSLASTPTPTRQKSWEPCILGTCWEQWGAKSSLAGVHSMI